MIDAEVEINVTVICNTCKKTNSETDYFDPWDSFGRFSDTAESMLEKFLDEGWEIEGEDAVCPECIEAQEDGVEPLDPNRNNGGVDPRYGVGLRLFDETST